MKLFEIKNIFEEAEKESYKVTDPADVKQLLDDIKERLESDVMKQDDFISELEQLQWFQSYDEADCNISDIAFNPIMNSVKVTIEVNGQGVDQYEKGDAGSHGMNITLRDPVDVEYYFEIKFPKHPDKVITKGMVEDIDIDLLFKSYKKHKVTGKMSDHVDKDTWHGRGGYRDW